MAHIKMVFFSNSFGNQEHTSAFVILPLHYAKEYLDFFIELHNNLVFISININSIEFLTLQSDSNLNNSNFFKIFQDELIEILN